MYFDGTIHIEESDQCFTCQYVRNDQFCPLLEALGTGVVELDGDITVQNCGFYQKYERHLKVVGQPAADDRPVDDDEGETTIIFTPESERMGTSTSFTPETDDAASGDASDDGSDGPDDGPGNLVQLPKRP